VLLEIDVYLTNQRSSPEREQDGKRSGADRLPNYRPIPFKSSLACCAAIFVASLALASGFS
jgi:hypothetical protein